METQFYYDPDYRRQPKDDNKPYCCRCQKNVNPEKAIPLTINEETMMAIEGHDRHEEIRTNFNHPANHLCSNSYIGKDCWKALGKAEA